MIEPKDIELGGKTYVLSKFPATVGREIITQYVATGLPRVGNYKENEKLMFKLMGFVCVRTEAGDLALSTPQLIDNHVSDWEVLAELEFKMMDYNSRFFRDGRISTFFDGFAQKVQAWISQTLMASSGQSSETAKPLFTNSEPSTV